MRSKYQYLLLAVLSFCCFYACVVDDDTTELASKTKTVSIDKARNLFAYVTTGALPSTDELFEKSGGTDLIVPEWDTYQLEGEGHDALLATVKASIDNDRDIQFELKFLEIDNKTLGVLEAVLPDATIIDGEVIDGDVYYYDFNGVFVLGFRIKNGFITHHLVFKGNTQQAGLSSLLSSLGMNTECDANLVAFLGDGFFCVDDTLDPVLVTARKDPWVDPDSWSYIVDILDHLPVDSETLADPENPTGGGGGDSSNQCTGENKVYNKTTKRCDCIEGTQADAQGNCVKDCILDNEDLKKSFGGKNSILEGLTEAIKKWGAKLGITKDIEVQHFLAQASVESHNFNSTQEYTNYQPHVLMDKFGDFFNDIGNDDLDANKKNLSDFGTHIRSNGKTYITDKEKLFNFIYSDEERSKVNWSPLGNTHPGDGYKYIGRGVIQITGHDNYKNFSRWLNNNTEFNVDIMSNPSKLNTNKEIGALTSLWYFKSNVMDKLGGIDDKTKSESVTKKVNVAGLEANQRKKNLIIAKKNINCID